MKTKRYLMPVFALVFAALCAGAEDGENAFAEGASEAFAIETRQMDEAWSAGALEHGGGTLTADETWAAGSVHVVYGTVIVATNATLTIEPSAVVKFLGGGIIAAGTCVANGATFTDIADGATGGGHGVAALPMPSYVLKGNIETDDTTRIRFAKNGDEFAADGASNVFAISLRTDAEIPAGAVEHGGGILAADETWTAGSVHVVYGTVVVATNATLTIEPGAVVKFLGGGIIAAGTCVANGATFTDIADGSGLAMPSYVLRGNFETDAATRIRFAKNGDGAAADGGSGAFSIDMSDDEFRLAHEEEAISFSSVWANGTGVKVSVVKPDGGIETLVNESGAAAGVASWAKPAAMGLYELRHESGGETLTAKFAVVDGVVHDGTIAEGETWGKGKVHIVGNNLKVADGATLTIEPGAVVKFLDGKTLTIEAGGACVAEGVVFTSIHDDTAGGDSFNDGGATAPSTNGYAIVGFVRDDLATEYRYGVQSYAGALAGEVTWRKERTYVIDGTLTVATNGILTIPAGTVVKFTEGSGIKVAAGGVCMAEGAVFTHIADDAVGGDTMGDGDATVPEYGKYTVDVAVLDSDETEYRYSAPIVTSGTLNGSNVWRARQVYHVTGNLTLASGATLTIAPGSVVKFNPNTSLTVNSGAILNAQGTRSSPIVFTSVKDDVHGGDTNGDGDATVPNPGDWARVVVKGTVRMDNCVLMYGSASGGGNVNEGTDDLISILGGTAIFTNGRMSQMMGYAVGLNSGKFHMTNSVIEEAFCAFRHWPSEPVVNSVIYNCNRLSNNNGQVLYNCIIVGVNEAWDWSSGNGNTYKNCVFWNEPDFGLQTLPVSASPQNGNIWADPKFADPKNGDFRIAADSPCVDAGDATIAPAKDWFGQPRYEIRGLTPTGTPNADGVYADIGIYELQPRDAGSDVDLEAVAVAMPGSLTVGEKVLVTWRVANVGSARASGEWEDKLELVSPNGVVELGTVKIRKIVEPACEYVVSHEFTVPSLSEGTCSVRLRANCNSGIGEGSLVANNIRLSDSQSAIALSTKAAGAFSVSVPSRQTTSFRLGDDVSSFFVSDSKGILDVSMRVVDSETGHMRIVAGVAVAGGVVLSLPSDMPNIQSAIVTIVNGSSVAQTVACEASSTKCAVLEYTPERIGNKAKSVVSLAGYGMDYVANVKLSGNGVDVPCSVLSRSTGGMTVDVDGVGCKAGTYALAIELADGNMLPVGNVEMFSNGTGPRFEAELDIPSATRYGRLYSGRVIYRNSGDEDMTAPVLVLSASGADIGFAGVANASARIEFVALGTSSPHGVLKAGEVGWIEFKFKAGNAPRFSLDMLDGDNASWIEEKRKISEAATVLNGRGRRVFILEDILDYAKHSVSNSHAVCGKVIVNDGRTKNVTVVAETAEGEMVGTDIADANGVFVIDGLASASNYVLRIVSGASGGSSEIHMPEIGDLTGVCLEAMGLRTLHFSLAGIPTEEVVAGNLVVSDEYGEVLGTCRLDDGYVDYSSSNMVDMVFIEAKLDSGRMVRTCELVSPYDELLGMVTEIDFSEARLLKGKVCDGDGRGFAGARVRLRNVDFSVVKEVSTDDDGAYAIGGLEVGLYIVDAFTSSSSAEPLNVEVIPGADSVLDFTLSDKPTVCVSVSVSNVEGGAELVVEMGGMIVSRHEVDNALVSINDVPEGEYDFYLVNSDGILVSDVVSRMVAGTSVSLSLSMLQTVNCYGRICDTTGKGIVGFCEIKPFRGRPWRVYSDEEGVLEFSIPQGRYWMQCGAPGFCDRAFHAAVGNDIEFTISLNDFADVVDEEIGVDSDDFVHDEDVSDMITFAGSFYSSGEINLEFLDEGFEVLDDARLVGPSGQWRVETVPSECAYVWATDNTGLGILRTRKNFENGTVVFDTHDASLADVQFEVYADSEHATPLADVTVRLTGSVSNTLACTTDHSGRVHFRVSPGDYHVDFGRTCVDVMSIGTIEIGTGESTTIQLCYSAANGSGYTTLSSIGGGESLGVAKPKARLAGVNLNELAVKFGMNVRQFAGDSWSFIKVVSPASMSGRISKAVSGVVYYSSSLSGNYVLDEPSYKCEHNMDTWNENKIAKMEYDFYLSQAQYDEELSRLALLRFYVSLADTILGYNPEYAIGSTAGSLLNALIAKFQQGKVDAAKQLNGIQSDLDVAYLKDEELVGKIVSKESELSKLDVNRNICTKRIKEIIHTYGNDIRTYPENIRKAYISFQIKEYEFTTSIETETKTLSALKKQREALAVNINRLTKNLGKIANKIGNVKLVRQGGKWVKWAFIAYDFNNLRQLAGEADRAVASMSDNVSKTASAHMRLMDSWKKGYHDSCGSDNFDNNSVTNITDGSASTFNSEDPNEMVGPAGVGDSRYVKPGDWMDYTIYFENMTNATAAAQDVYVTLPKDAGLDWSTFELGEVVFGENIDAALSGAYDGESSYTIPGTNWSVRTVVAHTVDAVKWHLRIVDPTTPDNYPSDAYDGFLPPNDETGRGEGHIRFRVKVRDDAKPGSVINVSASIVFDYNAPIETDPAWWNTVSPVGQFLKAGEYVKLTLAELGYDVPTDGTPYSVVAKGLPAGLKLVSNKAVTKKVKGKTVIVKAAKSEWWIEGVPTAALDFMTNPPYLVITANGETTTEALPVEVAAQEVTELEDLVLGQSINTNGWLAGVGAGWTVSGLPTGLKYATKKVTKKSGKKTVTVAEAYSVYGKTTKAGLFTITAKKKVGAFYETMKYRVLVRPKEMNEVDKALFGESLTNITTMAYVPINWNLETGEAVPSVPSVPFVPSSAASGKVVKVAGLPTGLTFAAATTHKDKKKKQVKQLGQTIVGTPTKPGTYVVTFTKNVKSGKKTVAKTAQILWVVEPNDAKVELGFNTAGGVIENGVVGLNYGDLLAFSATDGATVNASGLPAGIKLVRVEDGSAGGLALPGQAVWGFEGVTAKAGTYLVTLKATLNGRSVTQRLALEVKGLPAWAKGTFNGVVYATGETPVVPVGGDATGETPVVPVGGDATGETPVVPVGGDATGETPVVPEDAQAARFTNGLATVTVSSVGKISGKFQEFGTNWTFTAASYTAATSAAVSAQSGETPLPPGGAQSAAAPAGFVCSNVVAKYAYKVTETVKGKKKTVTKYVERTFNLAVSPVPVVPDVADSPVRGVVRMEEVRLAEDGSPHQGSEVETWQNQWGSTYKAVGKALFTSKSGKKTLAYKTFAVDVYTNDVGEVTFIKKGVDNVEKTGLTCFATLSLKVTTAGAVTATLTFDTGKTKKDPKTKKTVKVYYKPTCATVVVPLVAADAETFAGKVPLYFAPKVADGFEGFAGSVVVQ